MRAWYLVMTIALCGTLSRVGAQVSLSVPPVPFPQVRATVLPLDEGAELITVEATLVTGEVMPILSVLRDTLGDEEPDNDLLRYVWIHTYAPPTLLQRLAAFVPFLYHPVTTRRTASSPPPIAFDLSRPFEREWPKISQLLLQNLFLDSRGWMFRVLPRTSRRNLTEYREAQIVKALVFLSLYEKRSDGVIRPDEMTHLWLRLSREGILPSLVKDHLLAEVTAQQRHKRWERRATNWDLLRQRAEEEGLFFEPLGLPGEPPSHALIWVAKEDVAVRFGSETFNAKFLNIANPWKDRRLLLWDGPTKALYLNDGNERVTAETPKARVRELIPLALYGLDFPRIPILLVDFRDALQVKARAASGRALDDSARYVLNVSPYGNLGQLLARSLARFVVRRKGIDLAQPSRLRSLAELRTLLLVDPSLPPDLKQVVARKADIGHILPLENALRYQPDIARAHHEALVREATSERGSVVRRLRDDREHEYRRLVHGKLVATLFRIAHYASLGLYDHHERGRAELDRRYRMARTLRYHKNRLRVLLRESVRPEQDGNLKDLITSLQVIQAHPSLADKEAAILVRNLFYKSEDETVRRLCLLTLAALESQENGRAIAAISKDRTLAGLLKAMTNHTVSEPSPRRESGLSPPTAK